MAYRIRSKAIIHEFLNDEVILADLDSGVYYSIRGCGIPIWQLLVAGYDLPAIEDLITQRYRVQSGGTFIRRLLEEGLIMEESAVPALPSVLYWPTLFQEPSLEKYEEMKSLLMLDPIHEVDEQGWPRKSVESPS